MKKESAKEVLDIMEALEELKARLQVVVDVEKKAYDKLEDKNEVKGMMEEEQLFTLQTVLEELEEIDLGCLF